MKKQYLVPETEVTHLAFESFLLASRDPNKSSAPDLYYEDEIDPWE